MSHSAPTRLPPGERFRRLGIAVWTIIGFVILAAMSLWLLQRIRIIFPPLVLALLIIYLLNPLVSALQVRRVPRPVGAVLTYLVVIGIFTLIVVAVAPFISDQVTGFADQWPEFRRKIIGYTRDASDTIEDRLGARIDTTQIECFLGAEESGADAPTEQECDEVIREARKQISAQAGRITDITRSVLEGLLVFVVAPLIALYILIDLPHLQRDVLNLVPASHRDEVADLGAKVSRAIGGFFRGQLLVAFIVGVLSAIGFAIIKLPFALLIGAIAGFFNLIPLVGPFVGGALGFLIGTVSGGVTLGLWAAVVELIVQQVDNHFISPIVMRRAVQLHPATVMLALLAGGTLAGFWGVLLAVPAVAVVKLLAVHFWTTRVLGLPVTPYVPERTGATPSVVPDNADEPDSDAGDSPRS